MRIGAFVNGNGTTFVRLPEQSHRVFVADCSGWNDLNDVQKKAICRMVWATTTGVFQIEDAGVSTRYVVN